jgi:type IV pilus assembly protein PilM
VRNKEDCQVAPIPIINVAPKRALGLHVGPAQIKLVEMERTGREPLITQMLWEETPPEAYVGNRLENPGALAGVLIRMLQAARIRTRFALAAVDGSEVITRTINLPNMPIRELRKAIMFETEASLPSGTGDNVLDYAILRTFVSEEDNTEKVAVLIISAQKQPLGLLVEAMLESGLRPNALDLTPVAAHRAESRSPKIQERGGEYILMTVNDRCTDLTIVYDGQVRILRSIPIGSVGFLDALGEKHLFDSGLGESAVSKHAAKVAAEEEDLGIVHHREEDLEFGAFGEDPFSAEMSARDEALAREGFEERDELARLNPLMTELVDEALNTIRYGQSFSKERTEIAFGVIDGYFPYGKQFVRSMSDKLGIPVVSGDPLSGLRIAESGIREDLIRDFAPDFSCAVGLALRGIRQFG